MSWLPEQKQKPQLSFCSSFISSPVVSEHVSWFCPRSLRILKNSQRYTCKKCLKRLDQVYVVLICLLTSSFQLTSCGLVLCCLPQAKKNKQTNKNKKRKTMNLVFTSRKDVHGFWSDTRSQVVRRDAFNARWEHTSLELSTWTDFKTRWERGLCV